MKLRTVGDLLRVLMRFDPATAIGVVVANPGPGRYETFPVVREFVVEVRDLQRTEPEQEELTGTRWYDPRETYSKDQRKMGGVVETVIVLSGGNK